MAAEALLVFFFLFLFAIVLPLATLVDASQNSSHPSILWAIVVFLAPLLGVVLYVLLGRDGGDDGPSKATRSDLPSQFRE